MTHRSRALLSRPALAALALTVPLGGVAAAQGGSAEELVVGTKVAEPFAIRSDDGGWRGISIELWEAVADRLDLSFRFVESDLEGLVTGLVADGADGPTLDASVAALTITPEREKQIDFTHPFHPTGLAIAVPVEEGGVFSGAIAALVSPEFLGGIAALAAVLLATGALVWWFERRRNEDFGGTMVEGIGNGFWWSATTMTTVGYGDKAPRTPIGRAIALVWMFASIITISGFTAAIASSLTVTGLEGRVQGPEDLPKVRVATVEDSTSEAWLRGRGMRPVTTPTVADAVARLASGEVGAVVYDAPILRYTVLERNRDDLAVLPGTFERQDYAIGLPLGSDLRKRVNTALLEVLETEEWDAILDRYLGAE